MLNNKERIDNRRTLIIEDANAQNNYFDCDVIAYNITKILEATTNEDIVNFTTDLIGAIGYRGGKLDNIKGFLEEIKDIIPVTLRGIQEKKQNATDAVVKNCGVFFAFSKDQFEKNKTPLAREKYVYIGFGGFIPKSKVDEYLAGIKSAIDTFESEINANNLREKYMLYELNNHEAFYTGRIDDTISALIGKYTKEEVMEVYNKFKSQKYVTK